VAIKTPIFVRLFSEKEHETLQAGLRFKDAFILRRSEMLLASSKGNEVPRIAENPGCGQQSVRDAIHGFDARGVDALAAKSSRLRFASSANPRCLRRAKRRGFEGALASFPERVRPADEPVAALHGLRGRLRGRNNAKTGLRRDDPGDAHAPSRSEAAEGEALDHLPRPSVREKKDQEGELDWEVHYLDMRP
jgi:hypothetical protein